MESNFNSKFLEKYAPQEERLSACSCRLGFRAGDGHGEMAVAGLYPGVQVCSMDFCVDVLDFQPLAIRHGLRLRYGFSGRCEVQHSPEPYVYADEGWIGADVNPPEGRMFFPTGRYRGIEIVIDLEEMLREMPCAWTECGIDILSSADRLARKQGRHMDEAAPEWDRLAHMLSSRIWSQELSVGDCRLFLLQMLWLLQSGGRQSIEDAFLTRGQRTLVRRAEEILTRDLRQRYTVAELAERLGVSPASLKKYFVQAYGKPISIYMRGMRVRRARELLTTTALSIAAIANEVGYENQGKFGAVFRQETGVTPLEYRRLHQLPPESFSRH